MPMGFPTVYGRIFAVLIFFARIHGGKVDVVRLSEISARRIFDHIEQHFRVVDEIRISSVPSPVRVGRTTGLYSSAMVT